MGGEPVATRRWQAVVEGDPKVGPSHFFLKYAKNFDGGPHHHTSDHGGYVLTGTVLLTVDGKEARLPPGFVLLDQGGGKVHSVRASARTCSPKSPRQVSKVGTISVNDDVVFVSTALAGQIVGLKPEGILRWRAHFFGVDLGMIEIAPLANVLTPDDVSSVTPVNAPHSEAVNATVTQDALLNARAVNA